MKEKKEKTHRHVSLLLMIDSWPRRLPLSDGLWRNKHHSQNTGSNYLTSIRHCDVLKCQSGARRKLTNYHIHCSCTVREEARTYSTFWLWVRDSCFSVSVCAFVLISLLMGENYLMSADMFFSLETFLFHTRHLPLTLL